MPLREVRFGSIVLNTNGIDSDLYETQFHSDNLPSTGDEHPKNWYIGKLKEIALAAGVALDTLGDQQIELIFKEMDTRISDNDIQRISQERERDQLCRDSACSYEESKGIFIDYMNAWSYAQNLRHMGLHPLSKRVHSDLYVSGEGSSTIQSEAGVIYVLRPYISISGLHHERTFDLELLLPGEPGKRDSKGIHDFVLHHTWTDGAVVKPEYTQVSRDGGPFVNEIDYYVISREDLETQACIPATPRFFHGFAFYGKMSNFEAFCKSLIHELDFYFARDKEQPTSQQG